MMALALKNVAPGGGQARAGSEADPLCALLLRVARADRAAFAELYRLTSPRLNALCLRTTRRADLAEEALQEGFIRVWRSASQFDPTRGSALAWITTVVRNRARTLAEKTHRQGALMEGGVEVAEVPDAQVVSGFDQVLSEERARRVRSCLAGVDGDKQRALLLVYFEGLSHVDLAARLGVPLGTAKSWVRRGLQQMGRCLGGAEGSRGEALHDLLAAEHELGVLPPAASPAFQRRRDADAKYCAAADAWADDFTALLTLLAPVQPRDEVWTRIATDTGQGAGGEGGVTVRWTYPLAAASIFLILMIIYLAV